MRTGIALTTVKATSQHSGKLLVYLHPGDNAT